MLKDSERILLSQGTLKQKYGYYRMPSQNPYELYDHYSVEYNNNNNSNKSIESLEEEDYEIHTSNFENKNLSNLTHDEFKNMLLTTGQSDPQTKFFLKNQHLSGQYIPTICGDMIMSDFDSNNYTPILDTNTNNCLREMKSKDIRYVSYKLINEMYNMLMYSGDLCFSIRACELIYSILKVNDGEFVNWCAGYYYMNRYNLLQNELIESTYKGFEKIKSEFVSVDGQSVIRCGMNFRRDV